MAADANGRSLLGNRARPELARTVKFPSLIRAEHGYGFHSVDRDVLDAARLDRTQIDAYIAALEGAVTAGAYTEEQLAKDRLNFATVDSTTVPEENLLHPSEDIKPAAKLEFAFQYYQEQEAKVASTEGLTRRHFLPGHLWILTETVDISGRVRYFSMQPSVVFNRHAFIFDKFE
ncbi:hypothetical protein GGP41_009660 [Bipolaris sorokiniana]|uniref:Uncharacterized protein n=2 Tax=Cochliobolus sativus TaxID=45130 RepID=A0A8H5ZCS7_COCSA|nr:uncharacterized protein COCSADRAFT_30291 [Bipolaris sorokiniana ND90Pr]EMD60273.1 hypothetical protein COCSADRAFT_30291 [Bipolaris sorokiniana ND90Pr]KAF5845854.1 hypothetical protein GGP41_009660 [Bipolaris sorokiniana]